MMIRAATIAFLCTLVVQPTVMAAERVTYIYRESGGSILYTDDKPEIMVGKGFVYMGSVNLPKPRVIPAKIIKLKPIRIAKKPRRKYNSATTSKVSCPGNSHAQAQRERRYMPAIERHAKSYRVDKHLIKAVMAVESCFDERAVSHAGAQGLMQLMPGTASYLGVHNPMNHDENIRGGAKYLRELLDLYPNNTKLALAAYNAGPGAVKKYGGIPPYRETQNYVQKVLSRYRQYKVRG